MLSDSGGSGLNALHQKFTSQARAFGLSFLNQAGFHSRDTAMSSLSSMSAASLAATLTARLASPADRSRVEGDLAAKGLAGDREAQANREIGDGQDGVDDRDADGRTPWGRRGESANENEWAPAESKAEPRRPPEAGRGQFLDVRV